MGDDGNKRRLWWVWAIWGAVFLLLEGYALITKEEDMPTLSRAIWWIRDHWDWFRPVLIGILVWLLAHLGGGECFANLCW